MRLYIPFARLDPARREAERVLREAAGGVPLAEGHAFEVGAVASIREARDVLARRLSVALHLPGAALLE